MKKYIVSFQNHQFKRLSDKIYLLQTYFIRCAIVSLKNPPFWSDEAIQFSSSDHVSIDEAIVSLQNLPV